MRALEKRLSPSISHKVPKVIFFWEAYVNWVDVQYVAKCVKGPYLSEIRHMQGRHELMMVNVVLGIMVWHRRH